ncbi:protein phosphatase 2C domain-containing protein [Psychrobacillus vulpis]|uniref:Protein phosphatase 2C domain-containing protein n=1 Tax=Psychrobacillus vulpis TaxID=2325572 RepID=A0A544TNY2_9BACI|nr:protein phosphatase 2C domain-containing protein [Psychrobacillus vulpis]TQR19173.1 protein phosphatase 2C domain-containing protein [Psychrobacillus vulpis]
MKINNSHEYSWVGSQDNYVDEVNIHAVQQVILGRFGGNSSAGQYKNEDGCLIWVSEKQDWELAILLDAHQTAESAELVISTIESLKKDFISSLNLSLKEAFPQVGMLIINAFDSKSFKEKCQKIQGETAFLCVVRKGKFLWWLSIGDCVLHLFHPELSALNEYQQNHRSFYEWVGRKNTFDLDVPCYSIGTKELRKGRNHIFLTTDGLIECPNTAFSNPTEIMNYFRDGENGQGISKLLFEIKEKDVRDSTTIVSWMVEIEEEATQPSDMK